MGLTMIELYLNAVDHYTINGHEFTHYGVSSSKPLLIAGKEINNFSLFIGPVATNTLAYDTNDQFALESKPTSFAQGLTDLREMILTTPHKYHIPYSVN